MFKPLSPKIVFLIFAALFIMFFLLSYFSQGTYDSGDGICHYTISKYSWQHPYLFLDSWGKPFFTLISSPFSQFGLLGLNVFNILCALLSAYICYRLSREMTMVCSIAVIFFLCFAPIYFPTMNSGLTEPFFGLVLITSIYLSISDRDLMAVILISFLPFVRTEGFLILPVFFIITLMKRQYILIPFLLCGTFVYSVIGSFYYHDLFWILHQNPYNGNIADVYGHGELLHFVTSYYFIWGIPLTLLFVSGLIISFFYTFSIRKNLGVPDNYKSAFFHINILFIGSFAVYFIAHSVMWWQGWANSLGLIRVMAGVMPCVAIICAITFENFLLFFEGFNIFRTVTAIVILVAVIISPFLQSYFPYKGDAEQTTIKQAGDWFKSSPYKNKTVYYSYPYFAYVINADPYNNATMRPLGAVNNANKKAIPDSAIIIWDAHFSPNESRFPLAKLMNDSNFCLLRSFIPPTNSVTLNNNTFAVYAFTKLHSPCKTNVLEDSLFFHFDENKSAVKNNIEYSQTITIHPQEIKNYTAVRSFNFKASVLSSSADSVKTQIVVSVIRADGSAAYWLGNPIRFKTTTNNWQAISTHFNFIPAEFSATDVIRIYIWNNNKQAFAANDFMLTFMGN